MRSGIFFQRLCYYIYKKIQQVSYFHESNFIGMDFFEMGNGNFVHFMCFDIGMDNIDKRANKDVFVLIIFHIY